MRDWEGGAQRGEKMMSCKERGGVWGGGGGGGAQRGRENDEEIERGGRKCGGVKGVGCPEGERTMSCKRGREVRRVVKMR